MNAYDRTPAVSNAMDLSPHIYESIGNGKSFTVGVDMDEKPPDYMESIGGIQGAVGGGGSLAAPVPFYRSPARKNNERQGAAVR